MWLVTTYNYSVNTKRKGSLAVGEAIAHFINMGVSVLIPVSDCDKYDIVIDQKDGMKRIQCKYSGVKYKNGAFSVDLRTFGGYREKTRHTKYLKEDFDSLFVYCSNGEKYLIPVEKIMGKSHLAIGNKSWKEFNIS